MSHYRHIILINLIFSFLIPEKCFKVHAISLSLSSVSSPSTKLPGSFLSQSQVNENQAQPVNCGINKLFHNETRACYDNAIVTISAPGKNNPPCGELMSFYMDSPGSPFGVCGCINEDGCRYSVDFNRPVLNWPNSNRCYFAYDQGPCKPGQWLVLNKKTFQSECSINPCPGKPLQKISPELQFFYSNAEIDIFYFLRNGTCHQTFTQAYCQPDEYVRFVKTYPVPSCVPNDFGYGCGSVGTTARLPCPQGYKRIGDECSPIADFQ